MMEISFYREKLSESGHRVLNAAIEESQRRHHYYLGLEHLFIAFAEEEKALFRELMGSIGLNVEAVQYSVNEHLNISRQYLGVGLKVPPATKQVFRVAWETAQRNRRTQIDASDLFLGIFHEVQSIPARILKSYGVDPAVALSRFSAQLRSREEKVEEFKKRYELPANLRTFAVNLNLLAREGKIPPIIGRDAEIEQIVEYLCHKDRCNSVMILGDPGVGKTAVVEGLAMRLEYEPHRVPERLRGHQVVNLQMNTVVAGTVFRGMFEDRIEKVIAEVKERRNIILFVDEAHTLVGAGSAMGVPSDAANIFKSALARGEVQIIGATTGTEYKEIVQEDEALARRFRVVKIGEPTQDETREILQGLKPRLEANYGVTVLDEAIEFALSMSDRYARSLRLPDKVINWLDTACVRVEIRGGEDKSVGAKDVLDVISSETKNPPDLICRVVTDRFRDIEEHISRRLVGQKEAVAAVAKALRMNKGPLKENIYRPDGVLLFLGPTGVGKTEMAKALAEYLFGDERQMVRVDMSEYATARWRSTSDRHAPRDRRVRARRDPHEPGEGQPVLRCPARRDREGGHLRPQPVPPGLRRGVAHRRAREEGVLLRHDHHHDEQPGVGGALPAQPADGVRGGLERYRAGPQGGPEGGGGPVHAGVHQPARRHRRLRPPVVRRGAEHRLHLPGLDPEDDGRPRQDARGVGRRAVRPGPTGFSVKYGARFLKRGIDGR
jgi:ATP-dependent Clp protease ATP-binding subunit ClpA